MSQVVPEDPGSPGHVGEAADVGMVPCDRYQYRLVVFGPQVVSK